MNNEEYITQLEKEWRSAQQKYSEKELLGIFPEVKDIIPIKIREYEGERKRVLSSLKKRLTRVSGISDSFSKFFWREWIKINEGQELLQIDKSIARLTRLLSIGQNKHIRGQLTEEQIEEALEYPIENLIDQKLKRVGKNLKGLCPLHQEKSPSFYVYPETNSFYCFGCNKGGNIINFMEMKYGYSFRQSVEYLTK